MNFRYECATGAGALAALPLDLVSRSCPTLSGPDGRHTPSRRCRRTRGACCSVCPPSCSDTDRCETMNPPQDRERIRVERFVEPMMLVGWQSLSPDSKCVDMLYRRLAQRTANAIAPDDLVADAVTLALVGRHLKFRSDQQPACETTTVDRPLSADHLRCSLCIVTSPDGRHTATHRTPTS